MTARSPDVQGAVDDLICRQLATEEKGCKPATLLGRRQARKRFHAMLGDLTVSDEEISTFTDKEENCRFLFAVKSSNIGILRSVRARGNIHFTEEEPADTTFLLAQAVFSLIENTPDYIWKQNFIFATDLTYRPHAEIGKITDSTFVVLLSRLLLIDLQNIAFTIYETIYDVREQQPEASFVEAILSPEFHPTFQARHLRPQFPYCLVALAEGEKYRFAAHFSLSEQTFSKYFVFYCLTICYVLAHEIGHFINGDLSGAAPKYENLYRPLFERRDTRCMLKSINANTLRDYWKRFGLEHARESGADFVALRLTINIAVDRMSNRYIGVAAASAVLATISWMDRARYFMRTNIDPAAEIGLENYNRKAGYIDVAHPIPSHPWGKTRQALLGSYLLILSAAANNGLATFKDDQAIMRAVANLFTDTVVDALGALFCISTLPGEYLAIPKGAMLHTTYWPDIHGSEEIHRFETRLDEYYGFRQAVAEERIDPNEL